MNCLMQDELSCVDYQASVGIVVTTSNCPICNAHLKPEDENYMLNGDMCEQCWNAMDNMDVEEENVSWNPVKDMLPF